jgi:hypothetical protein
LLAELLLQPPSLPLLLCLLLLVGLLLLSLLLLLLQLLLFLLVELLNVELYGTRGSRGGRNPARGRGPPRPPPCRSGESRRGGGGGRRSTALGGRGDGLGTTDLDSGQEVPGFITDVPLRRRLPLRKKDSDPEGPRAVDMRDIFIRADRGCVEGAKRAIGAVGESLHDHLRCEALGPSKSLYHGQGVVADGDMHRAQVWGISKSEETFMGVNEGLDGLQLGGSCVMSDPDAPLLRAASGT